MTGLTASAFGLENVGAVRPGMRADLTIFDPDEVADGATFSEPTAPSRGIAGVYVSGVAAWEQGRATGSRTGKVFRRAR
jgi:N-acyl-D-amino-acid deacylase